NGFAATLCIGVTVFAPLMNTAQAGSTVNVGVTNDLGGWHPYAETTALIYMIWCQTYGCLGTYNHNTGEFEGMLAESWEVNKANRNEWIIHLRKGLKRHVDGKEFTAE